MSETGSSNASGEDTSVTMWVCRKCPGQKFTAAEKDNHRAMHEREKAREKGSKGKRDQR